EVTDLEIGVKLVGCLEVLGRAVRVTDEVCRGRGEEPGEEVAGLHRYRALRSVEGRSVITGGKMKGRKPCDERPGSEPHGVFHAEPRLRDTAGEVQRLREERVRRGEARV